MHLSEIILQLSDQLDNIHNIPQQKKYIKFSIKKFFLNNDNMSFTLVQKKLIYNLTHLL